MASVPLLGAATNFAAPAQCRPYVTLAGGLELGDVETYMPCRGIPPCHVVPTSLYFSSRCPQASRQLPNSLPSRQPWVGLAVLYCWAVWGEEIKTQACTQAIQGMHRCNESYLWLSEAVLPRSSRGGSNCKQEAMVLEQSIEPAFQANKCDCFFRSLPSERSIN